MEQIIENKFYSIKEFTHIIGWSENKVQDLYNIEDFPSCNFGKEKKALGSAIITFFSVPRRK